MKPDIHPNYVECAITCACGNTITTLSTQASLTVEICSNCHPFFTGKQKFVDMAGRIDTFNKRVTTAAEAKQKEAQRPRKIKRGDPVEAAVPQETPSPKEKGAKSAEVGTEKKS